MSALMRLGLLTEEQAASITDAQADQLAEIATTQLQALATTDRNVQDALRRQLEPTIGAITRR